MRVWCPVMEVWVEVPCDLKIGGGDGRVEVACPMRGTPNCPMGGVGDE